MNSKFAKFLLIVLTCFPIFFVDAQNLQRTDSLEVIMELAKSTDEKIKILLDLSDEFKNNNPDKALGFTQEAFDLSTKTGNEEHKLNSMLSLSTIYSSLSQFKEAMDYAKRAEKLAKRLNKSGDLAHSLRLQGLVYSDLGEYDESSKHYFQSLKLYEQINDNKGISKALSNIASVYFDQQNYDKALEYYFHALNKAKEIDDSEGIAAGMNDIAAVYGNREQYDKVVKYLEEAIRINEKLGNKRSTAINYTNLGLINQRLLKYDEALVYFQKALRLFKELNHIVLIANCHVILSAYYFEINDTHKSIEYADKAYNAGKKYGLKKVVYDATGMLYNIYLKKADTTTANKYLILQYQMKDSLDIEKSATQLSKLELRYEFEKEKQAKIIKQQRKDFILVIIIVSLVFGLGIIILFFTRQKIKAKNTELEKLSLKKELEFKDKELALKVMSLLRKNEILSEISKKLIDVKNEAVKDETKEAIRKIYKELQKSTNDEIWEEFELRFKQVHSDFYETLIKKFPDLTPSEQRLCAFLRLNMSSKEISELTGQSLNALETARYRLRKKIGISNSQVNLITFLSKI